MPLEGAQKVVDLFRIGVVIQYPARTAGSCEYSLWLFWIACANANEQHLDAEQGVDEPPRGVNRQRCRGDSHSIGASLLGDPGGK
jgi:hypothetical protein